MLNEREIILRLTAAFVTGLVMGWRRTRKALPGGVRTHIFVCVTSTMLTIISAYGMAVFNEGGLRVSDPARLAVGIITGVGFLGAGLIWKENKAGAIRGLTTASSVWAVSGVGISLGLGFYFLAFATVAFLMASIGLWTLLKRFGLRPRRDKT
ncbi:hypothetical protein SY88_06980 [Clostridiales bacterium PH28_bin88]|nr:hypothetical protein SY88_06980 [Clostridiales bacterium PH28_bin88]